jgi:putative hydrolase of the HAD superfamily
VPEKAPLEAVLFDAGGTLVRLDFEWMAETLRELGVPASADAMRRAELAGRRRYDRSRGHPAGPGEPVAPLGSAGDTHAYFAAMVETLGGAPPVVDMALERFFARHARSGLWTRPMEGARETIDALAALGLRIAVVSNSDGRAEQHLVDCDVRTGVAFVVDSYEVGVEKPDPGIFRIALERLGVDPGRTLFVGDILSVDEAGARAAGTHFVLIDPYGDYAPPGLPAIARIDELPAWIAARFEVAAPRGASGDRGTPAQAPPPVAGSGGRAARGDG